MQWWIEQANNDRVSIHGFKNLLEVSALQGQELFKSNHALRRRIGDDHLLHERKAVRVVEHAFGAAESNAFGTESAGLAGIRRRVSVCPYSEPAQFVGITEQCRQLSGLFCIDHGRLAQDDFACCAIDCDDVALVNSNAIGRESFVTVVKSDLVGPHNAGLAQPASDQSSVRAGPATRRQRCLGLRDTIDVLR
jgi:hypothetical protein